MSLDPKLLEMIRDRLDARRSELVSEIDSKLSEAREIAAAAGDPATHDMGGRSVFALETELDMAQAARDGEELRMIEAAFGRMVNGSFGACTACGDQIAHERLLAQPAASLCGRCQAQLETWSAKRSNL